MPSKLIFERAFDLNPATGLLESYWEERWPISRLIEMYMRNPVFFSVSYLNDPHGLQGNALLIDWLHPYLPETLRDARIDGGAVTYIGVDTGSGGTGKDPDFCAGVRLEKIGQRGFLTDKFNKRFPLEDQAQFIEDWITAHPADFVWVEDITTRGYVWKDLTKVVNKGSGTRHTIQIWTPDKKLDKLTRYLSIAPRFESAQIMIPGVLVNGKLEIHPDWQDFVSEWTAVPSGHDDLLDAAYLSILKAFGDAEVVGFIIDVMDSTRREVRGEICERSAHLAYGKPLSECGRCMMERVMQDAEARLREADEDDELPIGSYHRGLFH